MRIPLSQYRAELELLATDLLARTSPELVRPDLEPDVRCSFAPVRRPSRRQEFVRDWNTYLTASNNVFERTS